VANKNLEIIFPTPYPAQIPVIKKCLDKDTFFITLNASRQSGKTFLATIVAVYWALNESNCHIMLVSPTDSQVKKIYKQIIKMLSPALRALVKSFKIQSGDSEIIFMNGSVILFRSAASENSLRGYSNTHLILDESAFMKTDTWHEILAPTLAVRGKKVLFCSTPKGKNLFYEYYQRGLNKEKNYASYKITYDQNPYANLEFIEEQKRILPEIIFKQEYLGEFVDSSSVFKNVDELSILNKAVPAGQRCTIGIDIAFSIDYTVAIVLDIKGNMLDYLRVNRLDTPELVKQLVTFINKWKPYKTIIEENNQGRVILDLLKQAGVHRIEGFTTTAISKNEIINDLMAAFAKKEIHALNDSIIKGELEAFSYEISDTGKVTFAARNGFHDDCVMSLAFAYKGIKDLSVSNIHFY
jgi:PBSX family phage terminase large subunit